MKTDENTFFRQATQSMFSSLDIKTAMHNLMKFLKENMPVSGMFFAQYEPDLNIGRILAAIWPPGLIEPSKTVQMPNEFWDFFKKKLAEQPQVHIINDIELEEFPLQNLLQMFFPTETSLLFTGLEIEGVLLGNLCLSTEGKNQYTESQAHLISLLHEPLSSSIANILQHQEILRLKDMLEDENKFLHQEMLKMSGDTIIGANFGLRDVMNMVTQVAALDSPVMLLGETGVGKEVIANAIHLSSLRKDKPYIKVNCGAIPENLIDSELFGHEKGAFTGAISRKRGRFERAHNGTIFLDEIGELPPAAQVRLLRVLQQREVERVGGTETIPVNARLISATNRNLEEMVHTGQFREDLWFRINVFPITIPPLRRRKGDIPALVAHFIERKSKELKMHTIPSLASGAMEQLQTYHWPGNVRELENLIERALIFNQMTKDESPLRFDHLNMAPVRRKFQNQDIESEDILPLDEMIIDHIRRALESTGGRVEGKEGAAEMLGLHPSTLRGRMKKLGIPYGRNNRK